MLLLDHTHQVLNLTLKVIATLSTSDAGHESCDIPSAPKKKVRSGCSLDVVVGVALIVINLINRVGLSRRVLLLLFLINISNYFCLI